MSIKNRRPTLRDIASAAGVSKSTVSLVLHESPKVSPETRAKVHRILKEYNYLPNVSAKNLAKGKTWTIGLVTKFFHHEYLEYSYFGEILGGILDVLSGMGYNLMLYNLSASFNLMVDGLILVSIDTDSYLSEKIYRLDIPTIFVNRQNSAVNYVTTDFLGGGMIGTKYLLDLGHDRIGFISGPLENIPAIDRLKGYKMALTSRNIKIDEELIIIVPFYNDRAGYSAIEFLMNLKNPPTAIFISSHNMALGVLQYLKEQGYKIPNDISILCFDDDRSFSITEPPLTVLRQNGYEIGLRTAQSIIRLVEGNASDRVQIVLPAELVVRGSCGRRVKDNVENKVISTEL